MTKKVHIPNIGISEVTEYIPAPDEEEKILQFEKQAEEDIKLKKQTANIHLRWSEFEIRRAKKIAEKLGMPYQTYIKSTLKQAMDNDEKKFN
ncbi:MAG: BrnA antitoxin family protein [Candidatus Gastranaerophilales bacterium]|nr:BrnA antitoxin family protein [Candidatus Gastranaerophilales bacterium]